MDNKSVFGSLVMIVCMIVFLTINATLDAWSIMQLRSLVVDTERRLKAVEAKLEQAVASLKIVRTIEQMDMLEAEANEKARERRKMRQAD